MPEKFQKIYLEIHNVCNLRCSFCPTGSSPDQSMDFLKFTKILQKIYDKSERLCLHLLGEPLLHPEIAKILDACQQYQIKIELTTNGLLIHKHHELLMHPAIVQINFSLQSFKDNFKTRAVDGYLNGIFDFIQMKSSQDSTVYINLRLWDYHDSGKGQLENEEIRQQIEKYFNIVVPEYADLKRKKSFKIMPFVYLHFDSRFEWPTLESSTLQTKGRCNALKTHIGILANGDVVPCCLDYKAHLKLGNILETDLESILKSSRALNMIDGFKKFELREELCQKCDYIKRF